MLFRWSGWGRRATAAAVGFTLAGRWAIIVALLAGIIVIAATATRGWAILVPRAWRRRASYVCSSKERREREAANIHAMHNINISPTCIAKAQAVIHVGLNISTTYIAQAQVVHSSTSG